MGKKLFFLITQIIRGFCFSVGDLGPGVSGSTTAVILEYYDDFIHNVDSFLSPKWNYKEKLTSLRWFLQFGIGWLFGILAFSSLIAYLTETNYYIIASTFLGMIIWAIVVWIRNEKLYTKKWVMNIRHFLAFMISFFVISTISYLAIIRGDASTAIAPFTIQIALALLIVGIAVAGGMLLPGFGGSTFLMVLGIYTPMFVAIHAIMQGDFYGVPYLICFTLGVLIGMGMFAKIISGILKKHKAFMGYVILGLMVGSIFSVIISPIGEGLTQLTFANLEYFFFLVGIAAIAAMDIFGRKSKGVN